MNLEDQIVDELGNEMSKDIDNHVLAGLYIGLGWKEILVDPWVHGSNAAITKWCEDNFTERYIQVGNRWVIESSKDALIFSLRWS